MPTATSDAHCPFCRTPVAAGARACSGCGAQRQLKKGMTPRRFRLFATSWLACTGMVMLFAAYVAFFPWVSGHPPPHYALALLGQPAPAQDRCTVEVLGASGARSRTRAVPCSELTGGNRGAADRVQPAATGHRLAWLVHSVLTLGMGALLAWALLRGLRRMFQTSLAAGWRPAPARP